MNDKQVRGIAARRDLDDPGREAPRGAKHRAPASAASRWGESNPRLRCGAPACLRNTSPAWRSRDERDLVFESTWAPAGTSDDSRVGWVGIEPTFRRIKNPLQG